MIRLICALCTFAFLQNTALANNHCSQIFSQAKSFNEVFDQSTSVIESLTGIHHSEYPNTRSYQKDLWRELESVVRFKSEETLQVPRDRNKKVRAKRNNFLDWIYRERLVEADAFSLALSDKLVFARMVDRFLGSRSQQFQPKTRGLVSFLTRRNLLDTKTGEVRADFEKLSEVFSKEFPDGFIIKPATGWSSKGKTFFKDPMEVFEKLIEGDFDLYSPKEYFEPFHSPSLGRVVSGERFIIQGLIGPSKGVEIGKGEAMREFRVHTLWNKVVPQSVKGRWIGDKPSKETLEEVALFVQRFLDQLPRGFYQRQAWSFDIMEVPGGGFAIVELNSNRGRWGGHWSGSIHNPRMLGAYVRYLERDFGWRFEGLPGWLFRNNLGNLWRYYRHNNATRADHNE